MPQLESHEDGLGRYEQSGMLGYFLQECHRGDKNGLYKLAWEFFRLVNECLLDVSIGVFALYRYWGSTEYGRCEELS